MEIVAKENMVTIMEHEESLTKELVEDPMVITRRISKGWKPQLIDELPCTFCGKKTLLLTCTCFLIKYC